MRKKHLAWSALLAVGCGSSTPTINPLFDSAFNSTTDGTSNGLTDGTTSDGRSGFQLDGNVGGGDGATEVSLLLDGSACASGSQAVALTPLDMVVLVDTSASMDYAGEDGGVVGKWLQVSAALKGFAQNPKYANMGMGLQFFPNRLQCNLAANATPAVPIGVLPTVEPAIREAIDGQRMAGGTPIVQVLQGMLTYSRSWAAQHPERKTVVVLATDGIPDDTCTSREQVPANSIDNAVLIASQAANGRPLLGTDGLGGDASMGGDAGLEVGVVRADTSTTDSTSGTDGAVDATLDVAPIPPPDTTPGPLARLPVFVVGVGSELTALHRIAQAGGTDQAIIISSTGNIAEQFVQALDDIRRVSLACDYPIPAPPAGQLIDPGLVNVSFVSGNQSELFLNTNADNPDAPPNCSAAAENGWYYDKPRSPKKIILCPQTCSRVQARTDAQVSVVFGCQRRNILR